MRAQQPWWRGWRERPRPAGPRVAVVTDSAAALPARWVEEHDGGVVTVVPMPVTIGARTYSEGDAGLPAAISMALAAGEPVSTSRPAPGQFSQAFAAAAAAGFEAIVSIHLSGKLSGTVDAARLASVDSAVPVIVIDTETVGMAEGFAVQAAAAAAAIGGGMDAVAQAAADASATASVYFYVPSLDQLRRGGRVGAASSWLGTVLAIKPLLGIRDGQVVPLEKVRTSGKAIARLQELARADIAARDGKPVHVAIHHFGDAGQATDIGRNLRDGCPGIRDVVLTSLPAVLAAHAGLGVLAIIVADAPVAGPAETGTASLP
ncbi:DegV family protein [Specibacter cremeus]|uniref:DegV family protein n=1 Tax=Specibacter cremeus TaxID=1629051 RepID=UPI000F787EDE|nr:DegV family protein [Specibacter cremeus]